MIRIINISDLHYRRDWEEEVVQVFNKFLIDLEQSTNAPNTYLLFSGDVVQAADDADLYQEFIQRVDPVLASFGIGPNRRFLIPGNHDVAQEAVKSRLLSHMGSIQQLDDETSFNNACGGELIDIVRPKFANFENFSETFVAPENRMSNIVGQGSQFDSNVGIYLLNTALTSHGGVKDLKGRPINDEGRLGVNTREIHKWLNSTTYSQRILMMHHPLNWLMPWAQEELENIIHEKFNLVISGHVHKQGVARIGFGRGGVLYCSAPPLFTRKHEVLGYTVIDLDLGKATVTYRQWRKPSGFVLGTLMSGTDTGKLEFDLGPALGPSMAVERNPTPHQDPLNHLKADFEEAATCYSSYKGIWIEREFSTVPENSAKGTDAIIENLNSLLESDGNLVIKAPHEFGLTSVGRQLALQYAEANGRYLLFLKLDGLQPHKSAVEEAIRIEAARLGIQFDQVDGFILDDFEVGKRSRRFLTSFKQISEDGRIIALWAVDDSHQLGQLGEVDQLDEFRTVHLWTLSRQAIRHLVEIYGSNCRILDEDALARKVVADLDSLNIPRTPINCLTLLKINEQEIEETPVNRTEMIRKVFSLFFAKFEGIPRYASRPDILDCEYALGVFAEYLIRSKRASFTKNEFFEKISSYSKSQILSIETDVLFLILVSEGIVTRRGEKFEFRFSYWLYYFAAHRMHHHQEFATYILSDRRYAAYPLIMEFYSGLDRRRSDAVTVLVADLREMELGFRERSGILIGLNPYERAEWKPDEKALEAMDKEVSEGIATTSLPAQVKDELADKNRDRSKSYDQAVAHFVEQSTMVEYVSAMLGASRVLRNSDHVDPELRRALLEQVLICWVGFCQIIIVLARVLAYKKSAAFEGIGIFLDSSFDDDDVDERWNAIMRVVPSNVTDWFHDEVFSKKLGPLFVDYLEGSPSPIAALLVRRILVLQRPPGWQEHIRKFISTEHKNTFSLFDIQSCLRRELSVGALNEKCASQMRHLCATALTKHLAGRKVKDKKLVERVSNKLLESERED